MSLPPVTIREATSADAQALAQLHVRAFEQTHGPSPPLALRERQWSEKLAHPEQVCFLAVADDAELVGFANCHPYFEADLPYEGQLEKIYVLRSWQGRGIGRMLVA